MNNIQGYLRLMRFDRPIGIFLLLWPTLWALWLAAAGRPSMFILGIFIMGVLVMRAAGCVINDLADRHFDAKVRRTKMRPLVTGAVSVRGAWILFITLCLLALLLVLQLHPLTRLLSIVGLLLAIFYPLSKRWMSIPQLILGLAFAWSIPMVFAEITQQVPWQAWLLFAVTVCWTVAYDTQYALVDRPDDLVVGIRSSAILFGRYARLWLAIFHSLMLLGLVLLGGVLHFSLIFFAGLLLALGFIGYQHYLTYRLEPEGCFSAFKNNQWVGAIIFLGIALTIH